MIFLRRFSRAAAFHSFRSTGPSCVPPKCGRRLGSTQTSNFSRGIVYGFFFSFFFLIVLPIENNEDERTIQTREIDAYWTIDRVVFFLVWTTVETSIRGAHPVQ